MAEALVWPNAISLFGIIVGLVIVALMLQRDRGLNTMSGPKGYPLIGIGLALPPQAPEIFREWAVKYGEIFKIRVGWFNWVVINSPEAMKEILDKQSVSTSSKTPLPIGNDLVAGGMRMFTMPYGSKWRAYRTIVHQLLSPKMTLTFVPIQEFEVKQLIYELACDNADERSFFNHIRRLSYSIITTSTFGRRIDRWDHPDVRFAAESSKLLGNITRAGAFIEDEIPPLAKLPFCLQPSRKAAKRYAETLLSTKMRIWNRLKMEVELDKAPPCFGKQLMESDYGSHGLCEEDAAWIAGGLVEAGSETTSVTLHNLILQLAANPHVQQRANDELTRVVGESRSPRFEDIQNLPYIRACIKEVLRLAPVPTWGIKHFADADIIYKQHRISKGTILLGNTFALHFDPVLYPDPHAFKPERYLQRSRSSADYAAMADPYQRDHFTFGMGRRICPGSRLAENTLNITAASILWAFEIRPPIVLGQDGKAGEEVMNLSNEAFEASAFRPPKPFRVRFIERSEARGSILRMQWKQASQDGYVLRGMSDRQ